MTEDTKRALEAIIPIAIELGINVDADDHFLYCDGQAIGIVDNSTYATINEFISYAVVRRSERDPHFRNIPPKYFDVLTRFWVKPDIVKKLKMKLRV